MSKGLTIGEIYKVKKPKQKSKFRPQTVLAMVREVNYVDALSPTTFNSTGSIVHLNVIPVNATVVGRVGKVVRMKSVQIRGYATAGTTGTVCSAALIIVLDRKPSGALPAITSILTSVNPAALVNDDQSSRYKILRRIVVNLVGNSTTPATGLERAFIDEYLMIPYDAVYDVANATGVIAQMRENALYAIGLSEVAAGTAAGTFAASIRVRYYDT